MKRAGLLCLICLLLSASAFAQSSAPLNQRTRSRSFINYERWDPQKFSWLVQQFAKTNHLTKRQLAEAEIYLAYQDDFAYGLADERPDQMSLYGVMYVVDTGHGIQRWLQSQAKPYTPLLVKSPSFDIYNGRVFPLQGAKKGECIACHIRVFVQTVPESRVKLMRSERVIVSTEAADGPMHYTTMPRILPNLDTIKGAYPMTSVRR